jgi:D-sedoheptulose 7-phosphate isomerase
MTEFAQTYLREAIAALSSLDSRTIDRVAEGIASVRAGGGRLFVLGVGGSAAQASHAVGDFRKLCDLEAYAPTDNVPELTARANDEGWESTFVEWLRGSRLSRDDALLVFSVGGGDTDRGVSTNLVRGLDLGQAVGAAIFAVVGRDGGHAARVATACLTIPVVNQDRVTAHTEGICAVVSHLLVNHPLLKKREGKWESLS